MNLFLTSISFQTSDILFLIIPFIFGLKYLRKKYNDHDDDENNSGGGGALHESSLVHIKA